MLAFISSVTDVVNVIIGELTRLFTYVDSYPIVFYILCISIVLETVIGLKELIRMN